MKIMYTLIYNIEQRERVEESEESNLQPISMDEATTTKLSRKNGQTCRLINEFCAAQMQMKRNGKKTNFAANSTKSNNKCFPRHIF